MEEDARMAVAAPPGSECSSGCQSGWTTYLDDDRSSYSYTYDTARLHGAPQQQQPCYYGCDYSEEEAEEDDLSMVSDASSGPRQQHSAGSDEGAAAALANARAVRRGSSRVVEPAAARRQSKMAAAAAVASTLLEDTASSPAFFKHPKQVMMSSPEGSGYGGGAAGSMMEMSSAADFSCAFLGYEFESPPLNASSHLGGYLQVQYPPAAVKPMATRQVCREGGDKIQRW